MLRAILFVLAIAACGQAASPSREAGSTHSLAYPVDPLPPDVVARSEASPDPRDYNAVSEILESAEPEMVRLRRWMTPITVKIDNLPGDGMVWTLLSFHQAPDENFTGRSFESRWIARRVRKAWDGQVVIDWADSVRCPAFRDALSTVTALRPPSIEAPDRRTLPKSDGAKNDVVLDREFTLWTTWAPAYDLRFSGDTNSDLGQWAIGLAIVLQPCWTSTAPDWPGVRELSRLAQAP